MSCIAVLNEIRLNEPRFVELLDKLIGESEFLQNSPPQGLIPKEDLAIKHIMDVLGPLSTEKGGPLVIEKVSYVEGRGNLIIKYPGTTDAVCSFVGSHMDVVPADKSTWERNPFKMTQEGDRLYGRGTTDCLGHVALLTDLLATLATTRPQLKTTVNVVFIANEEAGAILGVGIDQLAREGYLEGLKSGPVFWVDAADRQPCVGTAGMVQWKLKVQGKLFHSGLPHRGINSIEMAMDAMNYIQERFYADFPRVAQEEEYAFMTSSTMKPTNIISSDGSLNQLPPLCTISGDIRLAPFYRIADAKSSIEGYVAAINADPSGVLEKNLHGPHSKYSLPEDNVKGECEIIWLNDGEDGIACDMSSISFQALSQATAAVLGDSVHYSIGGSLPLVGSMQAQGFDIQIVGYGKSCAYHADNEFADLQHFREAAQIFSKIIGIIDEGAPTA